MKTKSKPIPIPTKPEQRIPRKISGGVSMLENEHVLDEHLGKKDWREKTDSFFGDLFSEAAEKETSTAATLNPSPKPNTQSGSRESSLSALLAATNANKSGESNSL